jgi:hypothetical protein
VLKRPKISLPSRLGGISIEIALGKSRLGRHTLDNPASYGGRAKLAFGWEALSNPVMRSAMNWTKKAVCTSLAKGLPAGSLIEPAAGPNDRVQAVFP